MTRQIINIGTGPDSYTGDNLRTAFTKVNDNFAQLYVGNVGANTSINVLTANTVSTNGNVNAGNVLVQYQVIASGNISGNYILGNGSQLTGLGLTSTNVAIGYGAGATSQGGTTVAVGAFAGQTTQGESAVAIGFNAGQTTQGIKSVAIGMTSGYSLQGNGAVAIGDSAGYTNQGVQAIAIGRFAGLTNQANNSIILNATGANLNATTANTFTVKPVRAVTSVTFVAPTSGSVPAGFSPMYYNPTTGEIIVITT